MTNLHHSLEEFSFNTFSNTNTPQPEEYYIQITAALIDALGQCPRLHTVSLTGDALRYVSPADLLQYGHLFRQLEFGREGRRAAYGQAISSLLAIAAI